LTREERKQYNYWLNRREINGKIEKRCSMCEKWKEDVIDNFYMINKSRPESGLTPACRICLTDKAIAHRLLNVEKARKSIRDYYHTHKDVYRIKAVNYKAGNREKIISDYKEWIKNNPDKVKLYGLNHRDHEITNEEWKCCLNIFNHKCAYCGISEEEHLKTYKQVLHRDHVDDEGANDLRNAVPACRSCNSKKHTTDMEEWFMRQKFFTEERLQFIIQWIEEGFKEYIEDRPPYKIIRKQIDGLTTYHHELWSVDQYRNMIQLIAISIKKVDLKEDIDNYLKSIANN